MNRLLVGLSFASALACQKEPATIQVKLPVEASISKYGSPPPPTFRTKDETVALRASAFSAEGGYMGSWPAHWSSNNPAVAQVDDNGMVTIRGSGEAVITAAGMGTKLPIEGNLTIKAAIVNTVRIMPPTPPITKLRIHQKAQLKAEALDERGNVIPDAHIHWATTDHGCWVTQDGEIEGAIEGTTHITAEADNIVTQYELMVVE